MAIEIVYETHSLSTDNEAGIATGCLASARPKDERSPKGRALAGELGERHRTSGLRAGQVFAEPGREPVRSARRVNAVLTAVR